MLAVVRAEAGKRGCDGVIVRGEKTVAQEAGGYAHERTGSIQTVCIVYTDVAAPAVTGGAASNAAPPADIETVQHSPSVASQPVTTASASAPLIVRSPAAVPSEPDEHEPEAPRRSTALMVTGIVVTSIAPIVITSGIAVIGMSNDATQDCRQEYDSNGVQIGHQCTRHDDDGLRHGGIAMTAAGGLMVAGGVFMTIYGAGRTTPKQTAATPDVSVGMGSASARWSF